MTPSAPRRALTPVLILSSCAVLVSGCAATVPMPLMLSALQCAPLIPQSYRQPVPAPALPPPDATAGDVLDSLDGTTSSLDQANARAGDIISIVETCDKRSAEVAQALAPKKPWWKRLGQ